jgi:polysaccharide biosynthesis/export protein
MPMTLNSISLRFSAVAIDPGFAGSSDSGNSPSARRPWLLPNTASSVGAAAKRSGRSFRWAAAVLLMVACATIHPQVTAENSASSSKDTAAPVSGDKTTDSTFVIGDDDELAVSVWKESEISRTITVRSDGKISLPLVGEVVAAGRTPPQLEQEITEKLKSYITEPEVTVMVVKINSEKFNILGQVAKPGAYPLTSATTIVDAIAAAGGFKDFAKKKAIYIIRKNGKSAESRIAFNYEDYIKGKNMKQNLPLESGDTIIVP